jgi:hypothetical protein
LHVKVNYPNANLNTRNKIAGYDLKSNQFNLKAMIASRQWQLGKPKDPVAIVSPEGRPELGPNIKS